MKTLCGNEKAAWRFLCFWGFLAQSVKNWYTDAKKREGDLFANDLFF